MTFICKVLKFSFLDGGHFGGHFEFINTQIYDLKCLTNIVYNLSKPCSLPNLKLISISDIYIENYYNMPFFVKFLVIFDLENDFFG